MSLAIWYRFVWFVSVASLPRTPSHECPNTNKMIRMVWNPPQSNVCPADVVCNWNFTEMWGHGPVNTLRPSQDGRHFPDDILRWIFLNENSWILINISLKFVPRVPINNIPALVQIMAWRRPGDKPLSEPMMVSLLTHICVTRPQWVNNMLTLVQIMSWHRAGEKPLSEYLIAQLADTYMHHSASVSYNINKCHLLIFHRIIRH